MAGRYIARMNKIIALSPALALAACGTFNAVPPQQFTVQGAYDHLGSCFARQTRATVPWGEVVSVESLVDPDVMSVREGVDALWMHGRVWRVDFARDQTHPNSTDVSVAGYSARQNRLYRAKIDQAFAACGIAEPVTPWNR